MPAASKKVGRRTRLFDFRSETACFLTNSAPIEAISVDKKNTGRM
jgi:hypothetical protein